MYWLYGGENVTLCLNMRQSTKPSTGNECANKYFDAGHLIFSCCLLPNEFQIMVRSKNPNLEETIIVGSCIRTGRP